MANRCTALAYRPRDAAETAEAVADAARRDLTVVHRGAGISYGDAALNEGGAVIHLGVLDRIIAFDAEQGIVRAEAGVTVAQLWKTALPRGWWPPVVPGTMHVTMGGATAMNIHGKNASRVGSFGEHVVALTLLDSGGVVHTLTRANDLARLHAVIGAQGLNGTILDVTLQLKRVHSNMLSVTPIPTRTLEENLEELDRIASSNDYAVGWIDAFASGKSLGRGLLHSAAHLPADHASATAQSDLAERDVPGRLAGVIPARHVWRLARPFVNRIGMRAINAAKYQAGRVGGTNPFLQGHAAFHFLLDYVPNWKQVYRPRGLMQYQFFAPVETATEMLRQSLLLQQRAGLPSFLAVLKRHRPDAFAASYSVNGYSLALDFPVRSDDRLVKLLHEFDRLQHDLGGRIYAAKDSVSHGTLPSVRDSRYSSNLARRWEKPR